MEYAIALLATLLLIGGFIALQSVLRVPRYRLERHDFRELLEDALAGRARLERWEMIIGMPMRHDAQLETWRARLAELSARGRPGVRNDQDGAFCQFHERERQLIQRILQEMSAAERGATRRNF